MEISAEIWSQKSTQLLEVSRRYGTASLEVSTTANGRKSSSCYGDYAIVDLVFSTKSQLMLGVAPDVSSAAIKMNRLLHVVCDSWEGYIIYTFVYLCIPSHLANGPWKKKFELYFPY